MKRMLRCLSGLLLSGLVATATAAQPVSFGDLARHASFRTVKISPDGKYAAATTVQSDGQTALTLLDLKGKKGVAIHARNGDDVLEFWWVSSDYVVYSVAEHLGGWDAPAANGELYSVKADGSSPTMLYGYRLATVSAGTHLKQATSEQGTATFLSAIDSDANDFLVSIRYWDESAKGAYEDVYRMDVRNGNKQRVAHAPMREASYLADHQGHVRFAFGDNLQGDREVYLRATDGDDWQLLKQASADRDVPLAFSADNAKVWFECPASPGLGVCEFDPKSQETKPVWGNASVELDSLAQGLARNAVIGVHFEDGRPSTVLFDPKSPDAQALVGLMKQFPGEDVQFVSGTADGSKAVVLVQADVDPGSFVLYDAAQHAVSLLAKRAQWIDPATLGRVEPFSFKARDGLPEQGYVTYPPGMQNAKSLPMVVFVHGGPYGIRDSWKFDPYVQAMATRGYAVLQVNYRGSGGYGYGFMKAGWMEWGGKMQDDVTDATRWAIEQGIADKDRICIYGGSYGGYAALEGAVKEPDLYRCAVGYVGVYDLKLMYADGDIPQSRYGKEYLKRVLGTDASVLAKGSPVDQLDALKAKVMLVVGGRDVRVPAAQGKNLHEALLRRGVQHEWLYKSDEAHGFYDEGNIAELFGKVDAFLEANIGPRAKGAKAPAAAKSP